jgi:uncharacterized glyoxalase superfamily protein PhnB
MQSLVQITLLVDDYDRAMAYYCGILGFSLLEDTALDKNKRWVVVTPVSGSIQGAALVLAVADTSTQRQAIGQQTGGRVSFFLATDDFWRDYNRYTEAGVKFIRQPEESEYGTVAVFEDLYGNPWDLIAHSKNHRFALNTIEQ